MANDPNSEWKWSGFDGSFEGTRRRQILTGLELTAAERLRWLQGRMAELLMLKGKASPLDQADRDPTAP